MPEPLASPISCVLNLASSSNTPSDAKLLYPMPVWPRIDMSDPETSWVVPLMVRPAKRTGDFDPEGLAAFQGDRTPAW